MTFVEVYGQVIELELKCYPFKDWLLLCRNNCKIKASQLKDSSKTLVLSQVTTASTILFRVNTLHTTKT